MNAEKTAVLVVTGIVAVLLAATLARSRPEGELLESKREKKEENTFRQVGEDPKPFVKIRPGPGIRELEAGGGLVPDPEDRPTPSPETYRIQPNDTFESIAAAVYGRRSLADLLMRANPSVDPRRLKIGSTIVLPAAPEGESRSSPPERVLERSAGAVWHVVKSGERLESIAKTHYGARGAWKRIYAANRDRLRSPHRIREGMRLRIP